MIPKRSLGKTGVEVSCVGLGGEGVLRTFGQQTKAQAVIERALELGINYFESARAYSGSESYYGMSLGGRRKDIFLASKSHERSATGAKRHLETSLTNLKTDWLDLWQVHDVRSSSDLKQIFAPGGAIETFDWAKRTGLVRFVGITGTSESGELCLRPWGSMNLTPC
jgi:aryl-alcohol dehydrogenase-like predicted oxidoreductase